MMESEERGLERGIKKGMEKGLEKGLQEGMVQGRKEGKTEGKIETARNLKQLGVSIDVIAQATGLSEEKIQQL